MSTRLIIFHNSVKTSKIVVFKWDFETPNFERFAWDGGSPLLMGSLFTFYFATDVDW